LAAPEQRSNCGFDASLGRERCRRKPPCVTAFAEGQLGVVHAPATPSDLQLVLGITNGATSGHQLVDQFLPEAIRDIWIGGSPASTANDEEGGRGMAQWWSFRCRHL